MKICALFLALLLPVAAFGQEAEPTKQELEVEKWVKKQRAWMEKHENRTVRNPKKKPEEPPEIPYWLWDVCISTEIPPGPIQAGCDLMKEMGAEDLQALKLARERAAVRTKGEERTHTSFWQMIHVDVGWMRSATYNRGQGIYGLVGAHFAIPMPGMRKISLTIPPGPLLLKMPSGMGEQRFNIGLAMAGGSFQVFRFRAFDQGVVGHVNLARVWVKGGAATGLAAASRGQWVDMMGLSFSFKDK